MPDNDPRVGATLYATAGSGNSFKPALALAQLAIPYRLHLVDVLAGETRSPAFLGINKAGQVPYFVDRNGFGVAQSNAMLCYIADGSHLVPDSAAGRAAMLQWMFFEQTRLEPNISPARFYTFVLPQREHEFLENIPRWRKQAEQGLALLDGHLATADFVVGQHGYSAGDIAVFGYVHLAGQAGLDLSQFRHVAKWIGRVTNTPRFVSIEEALKPDQSSVPAAA